MHGRWELLERLGDGALWCAGDVLGGSGGGRCVRWLREHGALCVRGNHEVDLLGLYALSEDELAWVREWPLERVVGEAFLAHCLVESGFLEVDTPTRAERVWARGGGRLVFVGHTHLPGWWEGDGVSWRWTPVYGEARLELVQGQRYVVNVGSLGEPRAPQGPCYVAWDGAVVEFRRL